ncbi:MAG: glycosyltransferase family A protein [Flavobacteriaceae bacterium]
MIASVAEAASRLPDADVRLMLLLQGASAADASAFPAFVTPFSIDGTISLSRARNRLLGEALARGAVEHDTVVAFPDDDCWYPPRALETIAGRFAADPDLDLWFCRYGSEPTAPGAAHFAGSAATARDVVRNASSNTIVVRGSVVKQICRFDETLGVGTPNFGGEDVDFALHAFRLARRAAFADAKLVGHRDKNTELRARYYRGSLIVLGRHAPKIGGARYEYARKLLVGAYLGCRGELGMRAYASAVGASLAAAAGRPSSA